MPKVLLVEDNEMNRDMLSRRLERKDYEVVMVFDGEAGVRLTREGIPDVFGSKANAAKVAHFNSFCL